MPYCLREITVEQAVFISAQKLKILKEEGKTEEKPSVEEKQKFRQLHKKLNINIIFGLLASAHQRMFFQKNVLYVKNRSVHAENNNGGWLPELHR